MSEPAPRRIVRRQAPADVLPADVHPVLRRVYAARGVGRAGELDYALGALPGWDALKGIEKAAERLADAIVADERLLVVADYDADGATGCAVAVRGLRALGARRVGFLVPNRLRDGYGLSPGVAATAAGHRPDLLITVDNGIASVDGVAEANRLGMQVIVTDHHLPGAVLPAALAIVNPNQPGCPFPSRNLAGVGVMFYVLLATRAVLRARGRLPASGEPRLAALLDLVALGTVADVVPLDHINRLLVWNGLARIRAGRGCAGVRALAEVARRDCRLLGSSDLGFALGPRLNAAGRLEDMALGIRALITDDASRARACANELDGLNRQRREIEQGMREQAAVLVERVQAGSAGPVPAGLCLHEPDWHPGVVGLVAGRIKERWHRPTVAFAAAGESGLRGSARSIPGVHIRDILAAIDTAHPGLIERFGGHAMAAGLSLERAALPRFRAAFEQAVADAVEPGALTGTLDSDGSLEGLTLDLSLAGALEQGGPWGQCFPEPLFDDVFELLECRHLGERHRRLRLRRPGDGTRIAAVVFEPDPHSLRALEAGGPVRLAYRLEIDRYWEQPVPRLRVELVEPAWARAPAGRVSP